MKRVQQWLKTVLTVNPGLKFLALVMAVFTFHSIRGMTGDEAVHIAPVEALLHDSDLIVLEQAPLSVSITLRRSREDLKKLDPAEIKAVLKLRRHTEGESTVPIRPRNIRGVPGVRVVKIDPDRATVVLAPVELEPDPEATEPDVSAPAIETMAWTNVTVRVMDQEIPTENFNTEPASVVVTATASREVLAAFASEPPLIFIDALESEEPDGSVRPVQTLGSDQTQAVVTIRPPTVQVFRRYEEEN